MTNGFSNDRLQETKPCGFLKHRLGKIIIYCNRPTPDILWYQRIEGNNVKVEALSFLSKPQNGMVGLEIYATERYEETKWKMGLLLRGPQDQIHHFECGIDTVFAKGMMWGFCAADGDELRSGEIGINPMPADPAKSKSKNPDKILYCNLFLNGRELPYFPGGTEHDWRAMAIIAMTKCNGYEPDDASIPDNSIFMEDKAVEKYNKKYGSQPATKPGQPARPTTLPARSGVTYQNQPFRAQPAPANQPTSNQIANQEQAMALLERETEAERLRNEQVEEIGEYYNSLFDFLDNKYKLNGMTINPERLQTAVSRGGVETFQQLTMHRKHQIIATFAIEILEDKAPNHAAIAELKAIVTPNPFNFEHFDLLKTILESALDDVIPF